MTGPKTVADAGSPAALEEEQRDEDHGRDRHDVRPEDRCRDGKSFDGAQHRDSGRDDAVPVQERRTEDPQQDQHRVLALARRRDRRRECRERKDAPLPVIVGPQHEDEVLERDDDDQCPEDQRQDAEDVVVRRGDRVRALEALADRVERARADVAVNDAERGEREHDESPTLRRGMPDVRVGRH